MKVQRVLFQETNEVTFELLDDAGQPIEIVSRFMRHFRVRDYSPNTLSAYCFDLLHFMTFLRVQQLTYEQFTPAHAWTLLEYLRELPSRIQAQRLGPVLCTTDRGHPATRLSPATINRILAAVSSFYEYLIVADLFPGRENPIQKVDDPALARVSARHRPFMGSASRQRPVRRAVRVKTVQRVPRPMSEEQIAQLRGSLRLWRDKAMILLMLQGGLRPGEVLCLQLADIEYGRRRVVIRYRTDHPKRARTKSRTERVVDLLEPDTMHLSSSLNATVIGWGFESPGSRPTRFAIRTRQPCGRTGCGNSPSRSAWGMPHQNRPASTHAFLTPSSLLNTSVPWERSSSHDTPSTASLPG